MVIRLGMEAPPLSQVPARYAETVMSGMLYMHESSRIRRSSYGSAITSSGTVEPMDGAARERRGRLAVRREGTMNTYRLNSYAQRVLVGLVAVIGAIWLAPSSQAVIAPPEPATPAGTSPSAIGAGGTNLWQVVLITLIAVAIGAVGTVIAQRMRRHDERFVTVA
jgi:hypothetical protein